MAFPGGAERGFLDVTSPLQHLWNIVAESDSASKCASNGTWTNPVARRELSKPVDGRANSRITWPFKWGESIKVSQDVGCFFFPYIDKSSREAGRYRRDLGSSLSEIARGWRDGHVFSSSERGQKDEKWQKEVRAGGLFGFEPRRVDGSGRNFHRASRRHRGARPARKNCTIGQNFWGKKPRTRSHSKPRPGDADPSNSVRNVRSRRELSGTVVMCK